MAPENCADRVRFTLSDEDGELRFVSFDIVGAPECKNLTAALRDYLIGRKLADVDLHHLRGFRCSGNGECVRAVIDTVAEHQVMLVPDHSSRPSTC